MGSWDSELIGLLPESVKVFASAGAGFDWADTKLLGERGESDAPPPSWLDYHQIAWRQANSVKALSIATQASLLLRLSPTLPSP